ncbi:glutamate 5-kinase [Demetria terragena]|uniref:glutamate 5-kinase n=1 Tax=Demetria terragena TaxID=63959 RepID=UPI00037AB98E|nr:glutamate 5-kinase [Demetria terragena]
MDRSAIRQAHRVVVKVGSSSLTAATGGLDAERVGALVDVLARRRLAGAEVILVSSGAIAAGMRPLGLTVRPGDLATQQAAASVGQGALMSAYSDAFARHELPVGQVLLTADDVARRRQYTNARRTLERLLELGMVPVVNENDTVATHEIRFGDNDRLAALVAHLLDADALVLLSDVDALYDGPPGQAGSHRIELVTGSADLDGIEIGTSGSQVGTGGMQTKVEAAAIATSAGVPTVLAAAPAAGAALAGEDVGTLFLPTGRRGRARRLWLAHATTASGRLVLDDGAVEAITQRGRSLLPAGVVAVHGRFHPGDTVDLVDSADQTIARGLVNYPSVEIPAMLGRSTRDLAAELGPEYERELVHRDDLVVLQTRKR